jgi:hypothetical protein
MTMLGARYHRGSSGSRSRYDFAYYHYCFPSAEGQRGTSPDITKTISDMKCPTS